MSLTTNLVSYWNLNGNGTDSAGSNTATASNITYTTGIGGNQCAVFNGSNAKYSIGSSNFIPTTAGQNWTLSLWLKGTNASSESAYRTCINFLIGMQFNYAWGDGGIAVASGFLVSGGSYYGTGTKALSSATWYNVVVTYDGSILETYYNAGTPNTNTIGSLSRDSSGGNYMGVNQAGSANWWTGDMQYVGLWSRALSSGEVTTLYNSGNGLAYSQLVTVNANFLAFM